MIDKTHKTFGMKPPRFHLFLVAQRIVKRGTCYTVLSVRLSLCLSVTIVSHAYIHTVGYF